MTRKNSRLDSFVAELAPVGDADLAGEVRSPRAESLLVTILDAPLEDPPSGRRAHPRSRLIALAAAGITAAILSLPAFGVGEEIVSIFGGWRSEPDYPAPVPSASDLVIASGEHGVAWRLVANRSDQGLCLGLVYGSGRGEEVGEASCGYVDLRGDLDPEVRGDPSTKCLASPTEIVPCGSLPRRWIDFPYTTDPSPLFTGPGRDLTRMVVVGVAAADVVGVNLVLRNGETVGAHVVKQPQGLGAPLNFYWTTLPLDDGREAIQMVVARDSMGTVLERRVPPWNGNPLGDPDGPPPPTSAGE
jgi:hypothetical protein